MRLCSIKDIEEDMVLGKSIYLMGGKLLLGAGTHINSEQKAKLIEHGYTHIYIAEEGTEDVIPHEAISEKVSYEAKNSLAKTIYDIQDRAEFTSTSLLKAKHLIDEGYLKDCDFCSNMKKIVEEILNNIISSGAKVMNSVMIKTVDSFFLDHALNVTVLAIMIGLKYRFSKKEILSLGL
jgi:HD-GYP domain-containing protein (c-di-GMP phosphodiesterase class II)